MVLVSSQGCTSVESNQESRNKPSHLWLVYFQQMCQDDVKWKTVVFSTNGARTVEYTHAKNEVWIPFSYTIINSESIIDISARAKTIKLQEKKQQNIRLSLSDFGLAILDLTPKAQVIKVKIDKLILHQNYKLLSFNKKITQNKTKTFQVINLIRGLHLEWIKNSYNSY